MIPEVRKIVVRGTKSLTPFGNRGPRGLQGEKGDNPPSTGEGTPTAGKWSAGALDRRVEFLSLDDSRKSGFVLAGCESFANGVVYLTYQAAKH